MDVHIKKVSHLVLTIYTDSYIMQSNMNAVPMQATLPRRNGFRRKGRKYLMKKFVTLFLILALLCACVPAALAENVSSGNVFGAFDTENTGTWGPPYDHGIWKKMFGFQLKQDANMSVKVYLNGELFNTLADNVDYKAGYVTVNWPAVNQAGWHPGPGSATFNVVLTAHVHGQTETYEFPYLFSFAHTIEEHQFQTAWYPNNTICVAGLAFRDVKPELTSKWYNFAALDLSQDGVQTFDLVASNMYVIGTVTVVKEGDEVVVEWDINRQGTNDANFQLEKEFLTIFSSLDAVTEVEPDLFEGPTYAFGQPISIANDLGGDTNVLLYIRNVATYCTNLSYKYQLPIYHARYLPDQNAYVALRQSMSSLMQMDAMK